MVWAELRVRWPWWDRGNLHYEERYAALIHLPSLPVCATKSVIGLNNNNNWIKDFLLFVNTNPFFMVCLICYLFSKMGKQDKIHEPNAPKFLFFHFLLNWVPIILVFSLEPHLTTLALTLHLYTPYSICWQKTRKTTRKPCEWMNVWSQNTNKRIPVSMTTRQARKWAYSRSLGRLAPGAWFS